MPRVLSSAKWSVVPQLVWRTACNYGKMQLRCLRLCAAFPNHHSDSWQCIGENSRGNPLAAHSIHGATRTIDTLLWGRMLRRMLPGRVQADISLLERSLCHRLEISCAECENGNKPPLGTSASSIWPEPCNTFGSNIRLLHVFTALL